MSLALYQGGLSTRSFDDLFDTFWSGAAVSLPRYTSRVEDDTYVIEVDLPGTKKDDIDATVLSGKVHVKAKRGGSDVAFVVNIPHTYDIETVQASMLNGVLTLKAKKVLGRKLEIT